MDGYINQFEKRTGAMMMNTTYMIAKDFESANVRAENIRFICRIDLPFRIRLGARFSQAIAVRQHNVNIYLRNSILVPPGTGTPAALGLTDNVSELFTSAVLEITNLKIDNETIHALRDPASYSTDFVYLKSGAQSVAMEALNRLVVAYSSATGDIFGGTMLRVFRISDFSACVDFEITYISSPSALIREDLDTVFALKPWSGKKAPKNLTGKFDDLADSKSDDVRTAVSLQADFVFYEQAFEAKTRMLAEDFVGALLMAVSALESAHAIVVNNVLTERLPDEYKRTLPEDYIRKLGMSNCIKMTPYLFMDESDRPSAALIRATGLAIKYRNEIMHGLRNKQGQYRMRLRTNKELCDGYSAILKVYDCYRKVVERQEGDRETEDTTPAEPPSPEPKQQRNPTTHHPTKPPKSGLPLIRRLKELLYKWWVSIWP